MPGKSGSFSANAAIFLSAAVTAAPSATWLPATKVSALGLRSNEAPISTRRSLIVAMSASINSPTTSFTDGLLVAERSVLVQLLDSSGLQGGDLGSPICGIFFGVGTSHVQASCAVGQQESGEVALHVLHSGDLLGEGSAGHDRHSEVHVGALGLGIDVPADGDLVGFVNDHFELLDLLLEQLFADFKIFVRRVAQATCGTGP